MNRRFIPLCLLALLLFPSSVRSAGLSAWPVPGHDAQATNFNPGETIVGRQTVNRLQIAWRVPNVAQAVATDDQVFALELGQLSLQRVLVLDARSGGVMHVFSRSQLRLGGTENLESLAYGGGLLVVASDRTVEAIDPASGHIRWRQAGGASFVTINGSTVYTGKGCQYPCGALASMAYDLKSGRLRWRHSGNFGGYSYLIGGNLFQTWGEYAGQTRVYDPVRGTLLATLPLFAAWTGDAVNTFADVVTGPGRPSWIGKIGADGRPAWKVPLGRPIGGSPVYAYGTLYVPSHRFHGGVVAVNASNGRIKWALDLGDNVYLAGANQLILALNSLTGVLSIVDAASGHVLRAIVVPRFGKHAEGTVLVGEGRVYVVDGSEIIALAPGGVAGH